jgi:hypothetical protein
MADFVFNIAKGRVAEFANRVDLADPANARFYVIPIDANGITDATLKDVDDFAALITAGAIERSATGWNRKTLTNTDIATVAADDTNDRMDIDIPDQTWTAVSAGNVTDLIIGYSGIVTPTNAQIVVVTQHDFAITPDGSDVTAQIAATGFYRAS